MKRTTISLPEELAAALDREARRRETSASEIVREALASYVGFHETGKRTITFAALGCSGHRHTARDLEQILDDEWGGARGR
ncbi:MAG: Ribbon-helix-helix protein copG family [Chloroflexota bacterium]|jgi:metal-responsive CopG/Arc/MetJ family transcriptional regulator|nr:Ribbon-helix-helix protein copG family [Chloroflexota bacterium]